MSGLVSSCGGGGGAINYTTWCSDGVRPRHWQTSLGTQRRPVGKANYTGLTDWLTAGESSSINYPSNEVSTLCRCANVHRGPLLPVCRLDLCLYALSRMVAARARCAINFLRLDAFDKSKTTESNCRQTWYVPRPWSTLVWNWFSAQKVTSHAAHSVRSCMSIPISPPQFIDIP